MGLTGSMIAGLALLVGVNLPAARLGLAFDDAPTPGVRFAPPGWLVVVAWVVLLPGLGAAHHRLGAVDAPAAVRLGVVLLAVLCATYAYTTVGVGRVTGIPVERLGLVVNAGVIATASVLAGWAARSDAVAAVAVGAVAVWTAIASVSVVQEVLRGA